MVPDRRKRPQKASLPRLHQEEKPQRKKEGVQEFTDSWLHFDFTSWFLYCAESVCGRAEGGQAEKGEEIEGPLPGL